MSKVYITQIRAKTSNLKEAEFLLSSYYKVCKLQIIKILDYLLSYKLSDFISRVNAVQKKQ